MWHSFFSLCSTIKRSNKNFVVSIAPIKYISINAASSFELLLLIKYMQKNLLLFLVVTKAHICMILRIKVHTCASESKLLNLIQKSSTFYYAKLMVYRQPCCELMMLFIFHIKLYDTHTHKTAVHTSFIMFHNTFIFGYFTRRRPTVVVLLKQ